MQQPHMRISPHNLLPIELENQSQHSMRRGMLRPEVDGVVSDLPLLRRIAFWFLLHSLAKALVHRYQLCAFCGFGIVARQ